MNRQVRVQDVLSDNDEALLKLTSSFASETYNNSQGEYHLPSGNWVPIAFKNIDSGISSEDGLNDEKSGYQGHAWVNEDTKQIVLANAGTKNMKDVSEWPTVVTGSVSYQVKSAIDAIQKVKLLTKNNEDVFAPYLNYEIVVTGHSLGGFFSQVQAAVYGLKGVSFDSPGGRNLINNPEFQDYLHNNEIESLNKASDFIDVKLGGVGPVGGGLIGNGAPNVDGVSKTYYIYGPMNIALTLLNVAAAVAGPFAAILGKLASGVLGHSMATIDESIQKGDFVSSKREIGWWLNSEPMKPFSYTDEHGNCVSSVVTDYGDAVKVGSGGALLHVDVKNDSGSSCSTTISSKEISSIVTDKDGHVHDPVNVAMNYAESKYMESAAFGGISSIEIPPQKIAPAPEVPVLAAPAEPVVPSVEAPPLEVVPASEVPVLAAPAEPVVPSAEIPPQEVVPATEAPVAVAPAEKTIEQSVQEIRDVIANGRKEGEPERFFLMVNSSVRPEGGNFQHGNMWLTLANNNKESHDYEFRPKTDNSFSKVDLVKDDVSSYVAPDVVATEISKEQYEIMTRFISAATDQIRMEAGRWGFFGEHATGVHFVYEAMYQAGLIDREILNNYQKFVVADNIAGLRELFSSTAPDKKIGGTGAHSAFAFPAWQDSFLPDKNNIVMTYSPQYGDGWKRGIPTEGKPEFHEAAVAQEHPVDMSPPPNNVRPSLDFHPPQPIRPPYTPPVESTPQIQQQIPTIQIPTITVTPSEVIIPPNPVVTSMPQPFQFRAVSTRNHFPLTSAYPVLADVAADLVNVEEVSDNARDDGFYDCLDDHMLSNALLEYHLQHTGLIAGNMEDVSRMQDTHYLIPVLTTGDASTGINIKRRENKLAA